MAESPLMPPATLPSGPGSSNEGLATAYSRHCFFFLGCLCLIEIHSLEVESRRMRLKPLSCMWGLYLLALAAQMKAWSLRSRHSFFLRGGLCLMGTHSFEVETIQLNRRRLWRLRAVAVKATRLRSQLCVLEAGYLSLL